MESPSYTSCDFPIVASHSKLSRSFTGPPSDLHRTKVEDCVGAIDGTHIRVKVSSAEAPKYRGRKDYPTQNVLAACTFDLKFTYVLPGWEGTTSDSRIIKNALSRPYPLRILEGKYYLVDAGFMLRSGLITPYRGEQYHLKEYSRNPPTNPRELFNLRHASLRCAIERAFGVLKKRFPIVGSSTEPHYGLETHKEIIFACCILHNYLMGVDPDETLIAQVDDELRDVAGEEHRASGENNEETIQGEIIRDAIAMEMWQDYIE
ncbi:putative nuclease HARBI1 [Dioscorea cayenensis subsp. rotundata]|uniref:Nuclease HARBI1 n=1 Tax=Dioscorea cayennensis subsp. rotundata TaxID=55577 RepID=A0AB40C9R7_DIOCR|nr:putative nuclease HARBI1 [Dioscorea cayenensis subsp. rotundata]